MLLEKLQTTTDLDGLLDILEMQWVRSSWQHAEMLNSDDRREVDGQ